MAASAVPGLFSAPKVGLGLSFDSAPIVNCALGDLRGLAAAGPTERVLNINLFRGFNVPLPASRPELVSLSLKCAAAVNLTPPPSALPSCVGNPPAPGPPLHSHDFSSISPSPPLPTQSHPIRGLPFITPLNLEQRAPLALDLARQSVAASLSRAIADTAAGAQARKPLCGALFCVFWG